MDARWAYDLYIDGEWCRADESDRIEVIDPATEDVIGSVPQTSPDAAHHAIRSARRAFDEGPWPWMTPKARGEALKRLAEHLDARHAELRELIVAETGSVGPITDAAQASGAVGLVHWTADNVQSVVEWVEMTAPVGGPNGVTGSALVREPVGVVAAITPFNFPFYLNLLKVVPAMAAGCSVVLKPHPWTPLDAFEIALAAEDTGIPPGVLNVITGGGDVGDELTGSPLVDMVSFTGSTATGRHIMARSAHTIKRLQLELGGKSAMVLLDDVPEEYAAEIGFGEVLTHCGQGCGLQTRLIMPEHLLDAYVDGVHRARKAITIGDPREPSSTLGPLIRERQRERVEMYVASGIEEGADLLIGGNRPEGLPKGFFFEPTVFLNAQSGMRIAQEEIFGPVLTVIPYSGGDGEAVRLANDTIYGLAGRVVASSSGRAFNAARHIRSGLMMASGVGAPASPVATVDSGQGPGWGDPPAAVGTVGAFGGYKQSGLGREWGHHGIEHFTELKQVVWN